MNKTERLNAANRLKAAVNLMWDRAIKINEGKGLRNTVSYRDIVRIADAIRSEGSAILGLKSLPKQIDSGLSFACAALDPDKARSQETIKKGLGGLGGAGGITLAWVCLGQLMNPGIWATVVAFFVGGIPGGPLPIVGIAAGLLVAAGAVWSAFQNMTPEERSTKAHDCVMKGIDNWVEYGSDDVVLSYKEAKKSIDNNAAEYGFSHEDLVAVTTLMLNVANTDGMFNDIERSTINLLVDQSKIDKRLSQIDALERIKKFPPDKRAEVVDWCFQVARADGNFHSSEVTTLKRYCKALNIDFVAKAEFHHIRLNP